LAIDYLFAVAYSISMKINNTSPFRTEYVKAIAAWCVRLLECEPRSITYRTRNARHYRGFAKRTGDVTVSVNPAGAWPCQLAGYKRAHRNTVSGEYETLNDATEALVAVTAHEIAHVRHFRTGKAHGRGLEDVACAAERYALRAFREVREHLGLSDPLRTVKPVVKRGPAGPRHGTVITDRNNRRKVLLQADDKTLIPCDDDGGMLYAPNGWCFCEQTHCWGYDARREIMELRGMLTKCGCEDCREDAQ
jgi:hypothetical protein